VHTSAFEHLLRVAEGKLRLGFDAFEEQRPAEVGIYSLVKQGSLDTSKQRRRNDGS